MVFYWGTTIAEYKKSHKLEDGITASWLEFFKEQGPRFRAPKERDSGARGRITSRYS